MKNFGSILLSLLIVYIVIFGLMFLAVLPVMSSLSGLAYPSGQMLLLSLALLLIMLFVGIALNGGLVRFYADCLKRRGYISSIFNTARQKFWSLAGVNLLVLIVLGAVLFLFTALGGAAIQSNPAASTLDAVPYLVAGFVVALLIMPLFIYVNQAVVLSNLPAMKALSKSISFGRKHYKDTVILVFIWVIIGGALSMVPIAGFLINLFVVSPLSLTRFVALYGVRK